MNLSQQAGTLCIYEFYEASVLDYFELQKVILGDTLTILNAYYMESLEDQLLLFEELDGNAYLNLILLEANSDGSREYEQLIQAWKDGDNTTLELMLFEDYLTDIIMGENLMEKLIIERNFKMTAKIRDYLEAEKDYFIVVGAGHFIGNQGIISLLEKEGYIIERM